MHMHLQVLHMRIYASQIPQQRGKSGVPKRWGGVGHTIDRRISEPRAYSSLTFKLTFYGRPHELCAYVMRLHEFHFRRARAVDE